MPSRSVILRIWAAANLRRGVELTLPVSVVLSDPLSMGSEGSLLTGREFLHLALSFENNTLMANDLPTPMLALWVRMAYFCFVINETAWNLLLFFFHVCGCKLLAMKTPVLNISALSSFHMTIDWIPYYYMASFPTGPFTISTLINTKIDISELHKINWLTDFEPLKLGFFSSAM